MLRPIRGSHPLCGHQPRGSLSCDNLKKWGFSLVGWCCMCRCSGEMVDHLFFHCDVVYLLWSFVFRTFGIQWVLSRIADLLFVWSNWFGKHSLDILNFVLL